MLRALSQWARRSGASAGLPVRTGRWQAGSFRPRLEALEERVVPSITFEGTGAGFYGTNPPFPFLVSSPSAGNGFVNWPEGVALANSTIQVTSTDGAFEVGASVPNLPAGVTESVDGTAVGTTPFQSGPGTSHTITFSGTPAPGTSAQNSGKYSAGFSATSSVKSGESVALSLGVTVEPPPIVFTPSTLLNDMKVLPYTSGTYEALFTATVGSKFSYTVTAATASGTAAPITTSSSPGDGISVKVNGNSVTISGSPTAAKNYNINLSASASGATNTDAILLAVQAPSKVTAPTFYWQLEPKSPHVDLSNLQSRLNFVTSSPDNQGGTLNSASVLTVDPTGGDVFYLSNAIDDQNPQRSGIDVQEDVGWSGEPPSVIVPGQSFTVKVDATAESSSSIIGSYGGRVVLDAIPLSAPGPDINADQFATGVPFTSATGDPGINLDPGPDMPQSGVQSYAVTFTAPAPADYSSALDVDSTLALVEEVNNLPDTMYQYDYDIVQGTPPAQATAPAFTGPANTNFTIGVKGSYPVTASGTPAPKFTQSGAPDWVTLTSAGLLTGTPPADAASNYTFTITAANNLGSVDETFTLNVGAATDTWTGNGNGKWSDAADWSNGVPVSGDTLVFPANGKNKSNCVDDLTAANSPTLSGIEIDSGYMLTAAGAAPLQVSGNVTVTAGDSKCTIPLTIPGGATDAVIVSQGALLALPAALSGAGSLTKQGGGELDLSASNGGYTGTTTLQGGTLGVGSDAALGTGPLVINGGSAPVVIAPPVGMFPTTLTLTNELDLNGGTVEFPSGAWEFSKAVKVESDTEIDPQKAGATAGLVTLAGAITTATTPAGIQLTVGGNSPLTLAGSLDANTIVAVNTGATVNFGSGLHGKTGTIALEGTLTSTHLSNFAGTIKLQSGAKVNVGAVSALGTAELDVFSEQGATEAALSDSAGAAVTLSNNVVMEALGTPPDIAGLQVTKGPLTLSAVNSDADATVTGTGEIDTAAGAMLTLGTHSSVESTAVLFVGGAGTVQLGGSTQAGAAVSVITTSAAVPTLELLASVTGNANLTAAGGKLLSNEDNKFDGSVTLKSGTIQVGSNGALGTAFIYLDTPAVAANAIPAGFLRTGNTAVTLKNNLHFFSAESQSSGPVGFGGGADLTFTSPEVLNAGSSEIYLDGTSNLILKGTLGSSSGGTARLSVAGADKSDVDPPHVDLQGASLGVLAIALPGGAVKVSPQFGLDKVTGRGGTIIFSAAKAGATVSITNAKDGSTLLDLSAVASAPVMALGFPLIGGLTFAVDGLAPNAKTTMTVAVTPSPLTVTGAQFALSGWASFIGQPGVVATELTSFSLALALVADKNGTVQVEGAPLFSLAPDLGIPEPPAPNVAKVKSAFSAYSTSWGNIFG